MTIAVDFDGTIVEHKYPAIGKEIPFATATLRKLISDGHQLILWSVREGALLDEAVKWCEEKGVTFFAVNKDFYEENESTNEYYSRKLKADMFIDDRNIGGLPDWGVMYRIISEHLTYEQCLLDNEGVSSKKKHWWSR